jgi:hypothetical protein
MTRKPRVDALRDPGDDTGRVFIERIKCAECAAGVCKQFCYFFVGHFPDSSVLLCVMRSVMSSVPEPADEALGRKEREREMHIYVYRFDNPFDPFIHECEHQKERKREDGDVENVVRDPKRSAHQNPTSMVAGHPWICRVFFPRAIGTSQ